MHKSMLMLMLIVGLLATPVEAQTPPTILVFGQGGIAFHVQTTDVTFAQLHTYRVYVDGTPVTLQVTCALDGDAVRCEDPTALQRLSLTGQHDIEMTSALVAADGEAESERIRPFVLRLADRPAALVPSSVAIVPRQGPPQ